jgi:ferredoxin
MTRLRVDPIACDGHGLCAELFPEGVDLDDWGFPIIDPAPIPAGLEQHARRAVAACPKLALHLDRAAGTSFTSSVRGIRPVPPPAARSTTRRGR